LSKFVFGNDKIQEKNEKNYQQPLKESAQGRGKISYQLIIVCKRKNQSDKKPYDYKIYRF
jgi:hypothetical protein